MSEAAEVFALDETDRLLAALGPSLHAGSERSPGALAALENARLAVEHDPVRLEMESEERQASRRLWRSLVLARTVDACDALLRGERVPARLLDPLWLRHFRRRA